MPRTYEPIATTTLGSAQADITFTNIDQTFTDIVIIVMAGDSTNDERDLYMQVGNNTIDTGTNYSRTLLYGNGSTITSARSSNQNQFRIFPGLQNSTPNQPFIIQINNYANTTTNKTVLARIGFASNYIGAFVGLWRSTAAINQIKIYPQPTSNFVAGTVITLYGIKAA